MKTIKYFMLALFFTTWFFNPVFSQDIMHTQTIPLNNEIQNLKLVVNTFNGDIKITAHDKNEVIIDVIEQLVNQDSTNMKGLTPTPAPNVKGSPNMEDNTIIDPVGLKKVNTQSKGFEIMKGGNTIYVTARNIMMSSNTMIGFNIKIPAKCSVIAYANTAGNVEIEGIEGNLELNSIMGSIKARDVKGSVVTSTVSGYTNVVITKINKETPLAFSSVSGHIDVTLPPHIKNTFKINTDYGGIFTDFDITTNEVNKLSSHDSPFKVEMNNWTMTNINGGGPEITFKSLNGNIYIRKK